MNIHKSLFVILALLCCSGCSTVSLGYNYADWLLRYWINGYTSFSSQQKDEIHLEVADYMRWHRRQALPEYNAFLQDLNGLVNQDGVLTAGDITHLRTESARLYQLTLAPMILPAAHLMSTLDSRQIAELADTLAYRNSKQRKHILQGSEQELLEMRAVRHVDLVEKLVGRLSAEQEEKIKAMSLRIPFATRYYIEQREAKQARLIALLNNHAGENKIAALLRQWIDTPEADRSAQQQLAIIAYESTMNDMTVRIFELLTTRQKQHLSKIIVSYIDDFQKLNPATSSAFYEQTSEK